MHTKMTNNNNEKETMVQVFSSQDGPKGLKEPKKQVPSKESKKFLLKGLKSSF